MSVLLKNSMVHYDEISINHIPIDLILQSRCLVEAGGMGVVEQHTMIPVREVYPKTTPLEQIHIMYQLRNHLVLQTIMIPCSKMYQQDGGKRPAQQHVPSSKKAKKSEFCHDYCCARNSTDFLARNSEFHAETVSLLSLRSNCEATDAAASTLPLGDQDGAIKAQNESQVTKAEPVRTMMMTECCRKQHRPPPRPSEHRDSQRQVQRESNFTLGFQPSLSIPSGGRGLGRTRFAWPTHPDMFASTGSVNSSSRDLSLEGVGYCGDKPLLVLDGANVMHTYNARKPWLGVRELHAAWKYCVDEGLRVLIVVRQSFTRGWHHQRHVLWSALQPVLVIVSQGEDDDKDADDAYAIQIARRESARAIERSRNSSHLQGPAYVVSMDKFEDAQSRDGTGQLKKWLDKGRMEFQFLRSGRTDHRELLFFPREQERKCEKRAMREASTIKEAPAFDFGDQQPLLVVDGADVASWYAKAIETDQENPQPNVRGIYSAWKYLVGARGMRVFVVVPKLWVQQGHRGDLWQHHGKHVCDAVWSSLVAHDDVVAHAQCANGPVYVVSNEFRDAQELNHGMGRWRIPYVFGDLGVVNQEEDCRELDFSRALCIRS